jgi:FtsZ-binding cell division protein ZapB
VEEVGLSWQAIAIAVGFVAMVQGVALVLWRWSSKRTAAPARHAQNFLITSTLTQEVDDLKERMAALKAEVQGLKATKPAVSPYNQALHMAKQGYPVGEVASQCGISKGEAELIVALYRKSKINGVE